MIIMWGCKMESELPCKCGGKMLPEDRNEQFSRVRKGIRDIFTKESEEKIDAYTRNYVGYGPNYMYKCGSCGKLIKFIPDGRQREYD
jgi:hypothetical protein